MISNLCNPLKQHWAEIVFLQLLFASRQPYKSSFWIAFSPELLVVADSGAGIHRPGSKSRFCKCPSLCFPYLAIFSWQKKNSRKIFLVYVERGKAALGESHVEQQVSRQYCKLYRFNLQVLVATQCQFWSKLSAALWDHHTAGRTTHLPPCISWCNSRGCWRTGLRYPEKNVGFVTHCLNVFYFSGCFC